MTTEALSPISAAIAELLAAPTVSVITTRIRPHEPMGKTATDAGDARNPGAYLAFIVVRWLDGPPNAHLPIRRTVLGVDCYAATYAAAELLGMAVEAVFRGRGARKAASGLGTWHSTVTAFGPDKDPDTKQPLWRLIVDMPTTLAAIT